MSTLAKVAAGALCGLQVAALAHAQAGDRAGEAQPELPLELRLPPPAPLSPDDAAKTFALSEGFRIELVAAEPLIEAPVQAVFDEDGRLWVVEMRAYMLDADGKDERAPTGRISVLVDDDGDGRMDRATRFLDGLVLPRAVAPTRGGALVIAPPHVLFCTDTDGDLVADERVVVDAGIGGLASPEYGPNGLLWTLDGAFQCANHDVRYRFVNGAWAKERTAGGGQWGITKDALGLVYFNHNSDFLRGDRAPSHELARDPSGALGPLANAAIAKDQATFPSRVTPGVNRAYREGWLANGKLRRADAACAPLVFRSVAFGTEYEGDVFVCEPSGNLVKRMELAREGDFGAAARNAWSDREFLTSTDERFRPVNLAEGPDGALYVVDLYRGILQHKNFVTTFLRKQIEARELAQPHDRGRLWRVVREGVERAPRRSLSQATSDELVSLLASDDGFSRDRATQLFSEGDWDWAVVRPKLAEVVEGTRAVVRGGATSAPGAAASAASKLARIHALWALANAMQLDAETAAKALLDADDDVRQHALRASERLMARGDARILELALQCATGGESRLARQAFASLASTTAPETWVTALLHDASAVESRRAAVAGAEPVALVRAALASIARADHVHWDAGHGRAALVREIAARIAREGRADAIEEVVERHLVRWRHQPWVLVALVDGLVEGLRQIDPSSDARLVLARAPQVFTALATTSDEPARSKAAELDALLAWPGRAGTSARTAARELSSAEHALVARGAAIYAEVCAACHLASGLGAPGVAPPLRGSELVLGDPRVPARIVLGGLEGPLVVRGRTYDLAMPAWNASDADVAAVVSYVRREWGNSAEPITIDVAAQARADVAARKGPWRADDVAARATIDANAAPKVREDALALLNGVDLTGWTPFGDARWTVEGASVRGVVGGGAQSFLCTERAFGDFVLAVDVQVVGAGNSGIQVRSARVANGSSERVRGWQVEIDPSARAWSGGLYEEGGRGWLANLEGHDAARAALKKGEWNRFVVACEGVRVRTWINDVPIVDHVDPGALSGFVAFQVHSGRDTDVRWRDPRIEPRGVRAWELVFDSAAWSKARATDGSFRLIGERTAADASVTVRGKGRGLVVLVRAPDHGQRGAETSEVHAGVTLSEHGWRIDVDRLGAMLLDDAMHEIVATTLGDRMVVHVDRKLVCDVRGAVSAEGRVLLAAEPGATFELERADVLGDPR